MAVRIDGSAYLLAANAMRSSGHEDEWSRTLLAAEDLVAGFPNRNEMLPWERFFLAEYYHERERNDEAIEMLDSDPKGGWGGL